MAHSGKERPWLVRELNVFASLCIRKRISDSCRRLLARGFALLLITLMRHQIDIPKKAKATEPRPHTHSYTPL